MAATFKFGFILTTLSFLFFLLYLYKRRDYLCSKFKKEKETASPDLEAQFQVNEHSYLQALWNILRPYLTFHYSISNSDIKHVDGIEDIEQYCASILTPLMPSTFFEYILNDTLFIFNEVFYFIKICVLSNLHYLLITVFVTVIFYYMWKYFSKQIMKVENFSNFSTNDSQVNIYNKTEDCLCRTRFFYSGNQYFHWLARIIICCVSLSIPWEFIRLYQKAVAERAATVVQGAPIECTPHLMTMYDNFKALLQSHFSWGSNSHPCHDYYYSLLVEPLWEVTPLMVLSSLFTRCLLYPLEMTCSSLGRGFRFFFSEIPIQWQLLIFVVFSLMFVLLLVMLFGYSIHVPLVFRFEPRPAVKNIDYHTTSKEIKDKFSPLCLTCSDNISTGNKLSLLSRNRSTEETNSKDSVLKNNLIRVGDNQIETQLWEKNTPKKINPVRRRHVESAVSHQESPEKKVQQKQLRPRKKQAEAAKLNKEDQQQELKLRKKQTKSAKRNKEDPLYVP